MKNKNQRLADWTSIPFALVAAALAGMACPPDSIVAEIDGAVLTTSDLMKKNNAAVFQARNSLYEAEKKAANELVDDYLLSREAKRLGISVDELLKKRVDGSVAEPSEEALRVYYEGIGTEEAFEAVRPKILEAIRQRRTNKAKAQYIQSLREKAKIELRVAPPRVHISLQNIPTRGNPSSTVKVVEYADYECPYCQQIHPVVSKLEKDFEGKILFAFKDVPLPMHPNAPKAAEASHCAADQGKYWEYHDVLLSTKLLDSGSLKDHARKLSLDTVAFGKCLESNAKSALVQAQLAEAQGFGIPGTPAFFVNGRLVGGAADYNALKQVIEEELKETAQGQPAENR